MPVPTIIIFGASGDLTSRKLIPALFRLDSTGLLPEDCHVVGMARTAFTSEQFRQELEPKVKESITGNGESWYPGTWNRFAKRLHYVSGGPDLYAPIVQRLGEDGQAAEDYGGFRRLVVAKPFGRDLKSAQDVNEHLHRYFQERQIYRIDHYLGKDTVQNILVFRLA